MGTTRVAGVRYAQTRLPEDTWDGFKAPASAPAGAARTKDWVELAPGPSSAVSIFCAEGASPAPAPACDEGEAVLFPSTRAREAEEDAANRGSRELLTDAFVVNFDLFGRDQPPPALLGRRMPREIGGALSRVPWRDRKTKLASHQLAEYYHTARKVDAAADIRHFVHCLIKAQQPDERDFLRRHARAALEEGSGSPCPTPLDPRRDHSFRRRPPGTSASPLRAERRRDLQSPSARNRPKPMTPTIARAIATAKRAEFASLSRPTSYSSSSSSGAKTNPSAMMMATDVSMFANASESPNTSRFLPTEEASAVCSVALAPPPGPAHIFVPLGDEEASPSMASSIFGSDGPDDLQDSDAVDLSLPVLSALSLSPTKEVQYRPDGNPYVAFSAAFKIPERALPTVHRPRKNYLAPLGTMRQQPGDKDHLRRSPDLPSPLESGALPVRSKPPALDFETRRRDELLDSAPVLLRYAID